MGDRFSRQTVKAIGLERAPQKDVYHFVLGRSWPMFFVLVAAFFVVANMLFAWLYLLKPGSISNARPGSFEDAFYFSVQTLATIGYGGMYPASRYGHIIVALEAVDRHPDGRAHHRDHLHPLRPALSARAVLRQGGHLAARRCAARDVPDGQLAPQPDRRGAPAAWCCWRPRRRCEGDVMRRQIDLPLVRNRTGVFFLTWSAMHLIDEKSPFFGPDALERLRAQRRRSTSG